MELTVGQDVLLKIWHRGALVQTYRATVGEIKGDEVLFTNMLNEDTEAEEENLRINPTLGRAVQVIPVDEEC